MKLKELLDVISAERIPGEKIRIAEDDGKYTEFDISSRFLRIFENAEVESVSADDTDVFYICIAKNDSVIMPD